MTIYQDFGLYTRCCIFIFCFAYLSYIFGMICDFSSVCLLLTRLVVFILSFLAIFTDLIIRNYREWASKIKGKTQLHDKTWLHENYNDIIIEYENQFVAVYRREIIDNDKELLKLKHRLQDKNLKNIYIEFINPKEIRDTY